ncbi:MAG: calcium-binding protein [Solirubrobacteraceae bacterium]
MGGAGHDQLGARGAGGARILGGHGHDVIHGGHGHDVIHGGSGDDRIHGGHGDDRIDGGAGRDRLEGGPGHNRIVDLQGPTVVVAGPGRNHIDVADGSGDRVLCAAGSIKRIVVDRGDRLHPPLPKPGGVDGALPAAAEQCATGQGPGGSRRPGSQRRWQQRQPLRRGVHRAAGCRRHHALVRGAQPVRVMGQRVRARLPMPSVSPRSVRPTLCPGGHLAAAGRRCPGVGADRHVHHGDQDEGRDDLGGGHEHLLDRDGTLAFPTRVRRTGKPARTRTSYSSTAPTTPTTPSFSPTSNAGNHLIFGDFA